MPCNSLPDLLPSPIPKQRCGPAAPMSSLLSQRGVKSHLREKGRSLNYPPNNIPLYSSGAKNKFKPEKAMKRLFSHLGASLRISASHGMALRAGSQQGRW